MDLDLAGAQWAQRRRPRSRCCRGWRSRPTPGRRRCGLSARRRCLGDHLAVVDDDDRSARRSASSRYWVVSKTVVPSASSSSMRSHIASRLRGSRPVVGSSRKSTDGRRSGSWRCRAVGACHRSSPSRLGRQRQRGRSARAARARGWRASAAHVEEPADVLHVLAPGEALVDRGVLAGEADASPRPRRGR